MRVIELQALLHHHVSFEPFPHQSPAYNSAIATLINKGFIENSALGPTTSKAGAVFVEELKAVGEPPKDYVPPTITKAQLRKADQDARSMTVGEIVIGLFRIMGGTLLVIVVIVAFIEFLRWIHP